MPNEPIELGGEVVVNIFSQPHGRLVQLSMQEQRLAEAQIYQESLRQSQQTCGDSKNPEDFLLRSRGLLMEAEKVSVGLKNQLAAARRTPFSNRTQANLLALLDTITDIGTIRVETAEAQLDLTSDMPIEPGKVNWGALDNLNKCRDRELQIIGKITDMSMGLMPEGIAM